MYLARFSEGWSENQKHMLCSTYPITGGALCQGLFVSFLFIQGLDLEQYQEIFVAEEIDMTIVHALTESDLRSLGIMERRHQRRILDAARHIGEQLAAAKRAQRVSAPCGGTITPRPTLKQQLLVPPKLQTGTEPFATAGATLRHPAKTSRDSNLKGLALQPQGPCDVDCHPRGNPLLRSTEQKLLVTLYPKAPESDGGGVSQPTPPLAQPGALTNCKRVAADSSLWTSAALGQQVTETLEARLEKRKVALPSGPQQLEEELWRGGVTYSRADETRALKAMKLQALREELESHERTVTELRRLIQDVEAELGQPP